MNERAKMLEQLISEDPKDPFLHYALAMETAKSNPAEATQLFKWVLAQYPNYLPAYYQAALLHIELKDEQNAIAVLQEGINLAKLLGEQKTLSELKSLLDQLEE
ncbi:MAG: tetratricopeptide repeat protein [Flammeovirgaceae bacterium]